MRRALVAVFVALSACSHEAEDARLDAVVVQTSIDADRRVATAMNDADARVTKGDAKGALDALAKAAPLARENVDRAKGLHPRTPWGRDRAADATKLAEDRAAAIEAYSAAIRSDELERVVRELEAEKALEQRAAQLADAVANPPRPSGC